MTIYNKENPFPAKLVERYTLSKSGSTKKTYHISLDISGSNIKYKVGDAIAIFPENSAEDVNALLTALNQSGNEEIIDPRSGSAMTLEHFLKTKTNILRIPTPLLKLTGDPNLFAEEKKEERAHFMAHYDLIDFFKLYSPLISLQELISYFAPLLPRFYSIASSPKLSPYHIDLLVTTFTYTHGAKERRGVGSYFLCHSAQMHTTFIPFYLQPTPHFTLPENLNTPLLMIGPGTGVAPYRAFLQERESLAATGENWLFFGERNRATDYYYEAYLESLKRKGFLKLDLAFSRDQQEKIYVQHLLLKKGAEVWDFIQSGAIIYICGDARHMAKDVTIALESIIKQHSREDGKSYIKTLRREKRLLLDVY